jgi:hypothetical protein
MGNAIEVAERKRRRSSPERLGLSLVEISRGIDIDSACAVTIKVARDITILGTAILYISYL